MNDFVVSLALSISSLSFVLMVKVKTQIFQGSFTKLLKLPFSQPYFPSITSTSSIYYKNHRACDTDSSRYNSIFPCKYNTGPPQAYVESCFYFTRTRHPTPLPLLRAYTHVLLSSRNHSAALPFTTCAHGKVYTAKMKSTSTKQNRS